MSETIKSRKGSQMKVVVVGSGGREHALAIALGRTAEVVVTPGNPLIPGSTKEHVEDLVVKGDVNLVVIGSENDLVGGQADRLRAMGVLVLGPGADGAQIEGSKEYMKGLATEAGLRTAAYKVFGRDDRDAAVHFALQLLERDHKVVVKTSYLKGGKGAAVHNNVVDMVHDIEAKLADGDGIIVIEQYIEGVEVSVFAICDGQRAVILPAAQDFKLLKNGDKGPNTGGMGAWSPLPFLPTGFEERVNNEFIQPTLNKLQERSIDYRGVLYAGLMLDADGNIWLLEFNIRFGDPDSQVVLLRMTSDLAALLAAAADGDLTRVDPPTFSDDTAVLVVAAAEGYAEQVKLRSGDVIRGIPAAKINEDTMVLGAGVARDADQKLVTAGGRVLNVLARGINAKAAREKVYAALKFIGFKGIQYRDDIAEDDQAA